MGAFINIHSFNKLLQTSVSPPTDEISTTTYVAVARPPTAVAPLTAALLLSAHRPLRPPPLLSSGFVRSWFPRCLVRVHEPWRNPRSEIRSSSLDVGDEVPHSDVARIFRRHLVKEGQTQCFLEIKLNLGSKLDCAGCSRNNDSGRHAVATE